MNPAYIQINPTTWARVAQIVLFRPPNNAAPADGHASIMLANGEWFRVDNDYLPNLEAALFLDSRGDA